MAALRMPVIVQSQQIPHVSLNSRTERPQQRSRGKKNMAFITTTRTAPARSQGLFTGLLARLKTAMAQRGLYSRTLTELSQLNDRELADLGLSRSDIARVAHEAAYGN
jgi:uncharacterized protein YjiS (DUF1127 family)